MCPPGQEAGCRSSPGRVGRSARCGRPACRRSAPRCRWPGRWPRRWPIGPPSTSASLARTSIARRAGRSTSRWSCRRWRSGASSTQDDRHRHRRGVAAVDRVGEGVGSSGGAGRCSSPASGVYVSPVTRRPVEDDRAVGGVRACGDRDRVGLDVGVVAQHVRTAVAAASSATVAESLTATGGVVDTGHRDRHRRGVPAVDRVGERCRVAAEVRVRGVGDTSAAVNEVDLRWPGRRPR